MIVYTERMNNAINKMAWAHRNQTRKGSDLPYISHTVGVMVIASAATEDEDVLIACLFHDIVEDVPEEYSAEDIRRDFGNRVLSIVMGVTKDDSLPNWHDRAHAYLHHLEYEASDESVIVSAADKTHNLMSILEDYEIHSEALWDRFNAGRSDQLWWYQSVHGVVERRLPESPLTQMLGNLVTRFESLPVAA